MRLLLLRAAASVRDKAEHHNQQNDGADGNEQVDRLGEPVLDEQPERPAHRLGGLDLNDAELAAVVGHGRVAQDVAGGHRRLDARGHREPDIEVGERESRGRERGEGRRRDHAQGIAVLGEPHGDAAELVVRRDDVNVAPGVEAPIEQVAHAVEIRRRLAVGSVVVSAEGHGDEVAAVLLSRDHEAFAALGGVAGLSRGHDAVGVRVARRLDKEVGGREGAGGILVRGGKRPGGAAGDLGEHGVFEGGAENERQVARAGVVVVVVQAAGVREVGVGTAELDGFLVHERDEVLPGAAHVTGEHVGGVVAGGKKHAGEQVLDRELLSVLDAAHHALLAEHAEVVGRDRDDVVEVRALEHEQRRHHLGRGGGIASGG